MANYFSNAETLTPPIKRAAYSDRMSYMMAEMSRLAYFRFESQYPVSEIEAHIKKVLPNGQPEMITNIIADIIKPYLIPGNKSAGRQALARILAGDNPKKPDFELVEIFSNTETGAQGFLCRHKTEPYAVLAFRGTEMNLRDIKTDIKANLVEVEINGKKIEMHAGYWKQYTSIRAEIELALKSDTLEGCQLFITGHSLGGALAITATRFLTSDNMAACYTFGSPPVGTAAFDYDITTPIYRVINHVDIVPRLPNPVLGLLLRYIAFVIGILLDVLGLFSSRIRATGMFKKLSALLNDIQKYRQSGYDSYLTGEGSQVRLRYNVSVVDKFKWWSLQLPNFFRGELKLISDHSIDTYSRKLASWAHRRQEEKFL